jgi:hypothetical protein
MSSSPLAPRDLELLREASRLTQRYIDEVVLAFGLCPWAENAIRAKKIAIRPVLGCFEGPSGEADAARALGVVLEQTDPETELVLVPFPELELDRTGFEAVARELRSSGEKAFALAVFHPDPVRDVSDASRAVALFRRSPDPMIQAVRSQVLSELNADAGEGTMFVGAETILTMMQNPATRSVRQRVLQHNFATLNQVGRRALEELLDNIQQDRQESYSAIKRKDQRGDL